ncbi:MAG: endonuclease domain-containing protein [Brevundimonas sp.]|uniref:endonuclease domain-containing protein n=1 Tax=Brevundimonas sp. TaxID=1871086 RepID=UPI0030021BD9
MSGKIERAREMRKTLSPPEARMWSRLKMLRKQGFRFRRQAPFRGYFLDFVCFKHHLVIEVDGRVHGEEEQARHDRIRDGVLSCEGFTTLRFDNASIRDNVDGVMDCILDQLNDSPTLVSLRATFPPHKGEGES